MTKSATDVMQHILFAAVMDAVEALKKASKGLPNNLLRDLGALHVNAAYADVPAELQQAIEASVRTAFQRLQKEGYSVTPLGLSPPPPRPTGPRPGGNRPPAHTRPRHPAGDRPKGPRPGGARPPRPDKDK
ncbi:hypothetical protein FHS31_000379 [Sphingomonas vulcanisoli]|uniref:Uncharacterized protein n=1 Tax=Sphingomonas vulcanisoli TaxID=1658060 RepID=A0ABX0TMR4_9SPHN|nr:hypothetical protein [Sphingomonas vulcanisoli]NIJ06797.1 hypothetical protein [Sphingomonas vulcanisoli]